MTVYEKLIKDYLDKESEQDAALKAVYQSDKIGACFTYIKNQAKKKAVNGCAMIEDTQVYKWARDYFYDVLPNEKDVKSDAETEDQDDETEEEAIAEAPAKTQKKPEAKKQKKDKEKEIEEQNLLFEF